MRLSWPTNGWLHFLPTGTVEGYAYVRVANKRQIGTTPLVKITLTEISMDDLKLENMSAELQELINAGVYQTPYSE